MPRVDNGNYLWIQEFYSALNEQGRAGFVMAILLAMLVPQNWTSVAN
jgi:hypothetical protein